MGKVLKGKEQLTEAYGVKRGTGIHEGIDVVKYKNQLDYIVAIDEGIVDATVTGIGEGIAGSYGNYIWIQHGNGYRSFYAHLARVDVKKGQYVKKGQAIGYMGATGMAYGAHLHFEVEKNGKLIDPTDYVFGNKTFNKPIAINKLARTTTALNVRRKVGSISSRIMTTLPKGTDIFIRHQTPNKDGYRWYLIYYNKKGKFYQNTGYVARNPIGSKERYWEYT